MFGPPLLLLLLSSQSIIYASSYFADHIIVGFPRRDCLVLSTAEDKCPMTRFPDTYGPMFGGQVESRPTVCVNGKDYNSLTECYQYIRREWVQNFRMSESIMAGTSAQINNGSDMWVASGVITPKNSRRPVLTPKTFIVKSPTDIRPGVDLPFTSYSPKLIHFSGEKVLYIAAPSTQRFFRSIPINIIDLADANPKWTSLTPYTIEDSSGRLVFAVGSTSSGTYLYAFVEHLSYDRSWTSKFLDLTTNQWSAGPSLSKLNDHFSASMGPAIFFQGEIYMFGQSISYLSSTGELKDEDKVEGMHFPLENGSGIPTPIMNTAQNEDEYFYEYVTCSGIVDC